MNAPLKQAKGAGPVVFAAEAAERMLRASSYPDLRNLKCRFDEGVLTVEGQLPSYHLKQVAQSMLLRVDGVQRVQNMIEVGSSSSRAARAASWLESFAG